MCRPPPIPLAHLVGPPDAARRYRLLELVRARLRERRYSRRTEQAYVAWVRRYVLFHDRRHPRDLGAQQVREFLSALALRDQVSAATQDQALAALTFLYDRVLGIPLRRVDGITPARRGRRVPVVLSQQEVRAILARLRDPARLCAQLMYGSGLRVVECVTLRVKDVDFDRREIVVRGGKGGKDRRTPLAQTVMLPLRRWLCDGERAFHRDRKADIRCTGFSEALLQQVSECGSQLVVVVRLPCHAHVYGRAQCPPPSPPPRERGAAGRETGGGRCGSEEARREPRIPAFFRDPPPGVRRRHSNGAGAARPHGRSHDDDLHPRPQPRRAGGAQPGRRAVTVSERLRARSSRRRGTRSDATAVRGVRRMFCSNASLHNLGRVVEAGPQIILKSVVSSTSDRPPGRLCDGPLLVFRGFAG